MLAQGLGRYSSKEGRRRTGLREEEEELLHHCEGFEFRKKNPT